MSFTASVNTCALSFSGPFTQMVWQKSREFGVGKARSRSGKIIVVAHYTPAGEFCP